MTPYVADVQEDNPIDFILKVMAAIADSRYSLPACFTFHCWCFAQSLSITVQTDSVFWTAAGDRFSLSGHSNQNLKLLETCDKLTPLLTG